MENCDVGGTPTLFFSTAPRFCRTLRNIDRIFVKEDMDKVIFKLAEEEYMQLIDISMVWFCVCIVMVWCTWLLALRRCMPQIVRTFIMMENISYFWTAPSTFFWLLLSLFMIVGERPPLMFNVSHFALYILAIKVTEHSMLNWYRAPGESNELWLWRGQQSYVVAAPLYVMSLIQGTGAAWGITWRGVDKSFWNASDHGQEVIRVVTIWVTVIWISFIFGLCYTVGMLVKELVTGNGDRFGMQCRIGASFMLGLLAFTVWEPLLTFWGFDKMVQRLSKDEDRCCASAFSTLLLYFRSKAWIIRYLVDFALPFVILSGATGSISLVGVIAQASTVGSLFR